MFIIIKLILIITFVGNVLYPNSLLYFQNDKDLKNNGKVSLIIQSDENVKGIKFEISYNSNELILIDEGIDVLAQNVDFYYNNKEENKSFIVLFSDIDNEYIVDVNDGKVKNIIDLKFNSTNKFMGITKIELNNIIIVGELGQQLNQVDSISLEINYEFPGKTELIANFPNPFNYLTNIEYQLSESGFTTLEIFNNYGVKVKTLIKDFQSADYYKVEWNGYDEYDDKLESGKYLLVMNAPNYTKTITMILIR